MLAADKGIDLSSITGSGPRGRIKAEDVLNAKPQPAKGSQGGKRPSSGQQAPTGSGSYQDQPLSQMRKVIAQRLTESKQNLPHYYVTMEIKMDKLMKYTPG